jgi:two-component system chemotaxis response regulator CheY
MPHAQPLPPILYAEDYKLVADAVKETLQTVGFRVVICPDGAIATWRIGGPAPYSLFIFDSRLPHVGGLELVRYARQLPHRQHTPIIMLSASNDEAEAMRAGVDVFLRKPDGVQHLLPTITALLDQGA